MYYTTLLIIHVFTSLMNLNIIEQRNTWKVKAPGGKGHGPGRKGRGDGSFPNCFRGHGPTHLVGSSSRINLLRSSEE